MNGRVTVQRALDAVPSADVSLLQRRQLICGFQALAEHDFVAAEDLLAQAAPGLDPDRQLSAGLGRVGALLLERRSVEGQTKNYGVHIVIGPKTAEESEGVALLELDKIVVKGKREAVQIYTILGLDSFDGDAAVHAFTEKHAAFIRAYRHRLWQQSRENLEYCRMEQRALLGLYDLYEEPIRDYEISPPPAGWDGVVVAKTT